MSWRPPEIAGTIGLPAGRTPVTAERVPIFYSAWRSATTGMKPGSQHPSGAHVSPSRTSCLHLFGRHLREASSSSYPSSFLRALPPGGFLRSAIPAPPASRLLPSTSGDPPLGRIYANVPRPCSGPDDRTEENGPRPLNDPAGGNGEGVGRNAGCGA